MLTDQQAAQKLQSAHEKRIGSTDWRTVYDQEFTHEEVRDAADLGDIVRNMNLPLEELPELLAEADEELALGYRLFIAARMPLELAGRVLMGELDPRVRAVLSERCAEERRGGRKVIIPGE